MKNPQTASLKKSTPTEQTGDHQQADSQPSPSPANLISNDPLPDSKQARPTSQRTQDER
jgi:hypothetical protein